MELAKLYPDDFSSVQLKDLAHELQLYIDNVQSDERFSNLKTITELAKLIFLEGYFLPCLYIQPDIYSIYKLGT